MVLRNFIILFIACLWLEPLMAQVTVQRLQCEMKDNPMGIDAKHPRLSWQLKSDQRQVEQTAFQILVASSEEKLARNEGDLWNSGRLAGSGSIHIAYDGESLDSRDRCFWKVKAFTNQGETPWSQPAVWTMGLLHHHDWKGKWIGYEQVLPWNSITQWSRLSARYLRKEFEAASDIKRATVYVAGLGLYELYINGEKIGDQVLAPAPVDYRKVVMYNSFDVTSKMKSGENAIATVLGNGRYFTMRQDYKPKKITNFGFPRLLLQLEIEYANGKKKIISSDDTWKLNVDGPIRTNNEYDGEEYDARKEFQGWTMPGFNESGWISPQVVRSPEGDLVSQPIAPMKVMKKIKPVSIQKIGEKYILDMGQNFAGWLRMEVQGKRGDQVQLRFSESLEAGGELYVANLRDAKVTDVYTLKGEGIESWHPIFVYHGFRYVEITGYPGQPRLENFEGHLVYDDLLTSGEFYCSNETINAIHQNAWWGIASNYKGMPVDCPQRNERQPWLGDRAQGAYGESFLFGLQNFYAKWLDDIHQSQTKKGAIPDVAPAFWNYYTDNITWPGTYILVADILYRQYGDKQVIRRHYASMRKWMEYMRNKYMKKYILTKDKYGDWCVPPESLELIRSSDKTRITDGELISTAYYFHLLQIMKEFAELTSHEGDARFFGNLAAKVELAFNSKFFNSEKNYYANNTVTANLLPLYFGLTSEKHAEAVFNNIYNKIKIENGMHISTGLVGTQWLMRTLTDHRRSDIAYTLASNRTYPSWGYMIDQGATTIWELWNGNTASPKMNSQNHVMLLGDLLTWFYENLAGIKSDKTEVAFKRIIMKPEWIDGLDHVKASYQSMYGEIRSEWKKSIQAFEWNIEIPANTRATVYLPADAMENIRESGLLLREGTGIQFLRMEGKYAVLEIGSGRYAFHSTFNFREGIVKDQFIFNRAPFPESHAATIVETPQGILASWFGGTKEGNKDVCIWTSHYIDGKWTAPVKVADGILNDSVRYACYNPVLYYSEEGELLLFYKIGPNVAGWTGWLIRSRDDGKTWSKREALPTGFLGPIKNKPVIVNGKLVCPSSTEKNGWKVHFEITPDLGKTWVKTDSINDGKTVSAIQPSILTYRNGSIQVLCRSRNRSLNESWSHDGGLTWTSMQASGLPNNNSGTDAVTLQDGRQLLVYNHVKPPATAPNGKGLRTPLNVAISGDGKNWHAVAVLEDSPVSQYSYPSVIQTKDGLVHIVYTWRRERIKHVVIDPARIETKEIVDGKWPGGRDSDQANLADE